MPVVAKMKSLAIWKWPAFLCAALTAIIATLILAAPAGSAIIDHHHPTATGLSASLPLSAGINRCDDADLVRALKMFYDHYHELRPDQQRRLMQMLGQDLDKPIGSRPEIDWDQFMKSHDLTKSIHERLFYHSPYRGA
jgi:hypothetical protein